MANSHIAFQLPVVIGSTNKSLRFKYVSTTYTATIAEATYDDLCAVVDALETAMNAVIVGSDPVTASLNRAGKVVLSVAANTFELYWMSALTTMESVLGFSDGASDTGATTYTGDYIPPWQYVHPWPPQDDSWDRVNRDKDPPLSISKSGIVSRVTNPNDLQYRKVVLNYIPENVFHPDKADYKDAGYDIECTFLEFFDQASKGATFRVYQHTDAYPWTYMGRYALISPASRIDASRHQPGVKYYGPITLDMIRATAITIPS